MISSDIEHKLRVFISSKCGGRYTVARKALKALLEATGLIEAYVFETEPASSEDTKSAYLENVDESNLCIFLVDNADGVPVAVLSEEKRAKDKGLRLLYLFCDESSKEQTVMQKEIRSSLSSKYFVVHDFSDIVKKAYDSIMQDLVAIYRRKEDRFSESENEGITPAAQAPVIQTAVSPPSQGAYSLLKERYPASSFVTQTLKAGILPIFPSEKVSAESDLENNLAEQLNVVLNREAFNSEAFASLKAEVLNAQDPTIKELIEKRLDAQRYYCQADYQKCLALLQDALKIAVESEGIPTWLANDVAIDIRHVFGRIGDLNNQFTIENPGQMFIDESKESVFYPLLDRQVENMQEAIAKRYYSELTASPYSTQYGGLDEMFKDLSSAFCIAQMHGSIIQTIICKDRLISISLMLCTLYDDHDFVIELIRLLVVNQDSKKLDSLIRTYNQSVEIINDTDVKRVLDSVLCIPDLIRMYKSKYLLLSRFGYYMSEDLYQELYDDLVAFAIDWAQSERPIISLSSFIFDFYRENTHRADLEQTIDFVIAVFETGKARFYPDCFKVLQNIDYSRMSLTGQRKNRSLLTGILSGRVKCSPGNDYLSACTRFCKSATVPYKQIENSIARKHPRYYTDTFELEMSLVRKDDPTKYILQNIADANTRNETQGKGGQYSGYTYEPLDVIYSIISYSDYQVNEAIMTDIIESAIRTLESSGQTVSAKISAIKVIQLLFFKKKSAEIWEKTKQQIIERKETYTSGFEMDFFHKDTISVLIFSYDLLISCFDLGKATQVIEDILCLDQRDSLSIIRCLNILSMHFESGVGSIFNERILEAFLHFSVLMTQHRERDIKYHATKCLVGLTSFENTRDLALAQLSQIMNSGSQHAKIAILVRVGQLDCEDDSFVEQILKKGKADSNYLVRYVADRETGRLGTKEPCSM